MSAAASLAAQALRPPTAAASPSDCDVEPGSQDPLIHATEQRRLFPHGAPRPEDIHQGDAFNDCYLLAALAAAAHKHPMLLKSRLRYRHRAPDGTRHYSVHLFWPTPNGSPAPIDVCVTDRIAPGGTKGALWVSIFEKAFAKLNTRRAILSAAKLPGYDALRFGGFGEGISTITGNPTTIVHYANRTAPGPVTPDMSQHLRDLLSQPDTLGFVTFNHWSRTRRGADRSAPFQVKFDDGSELVSATGDDLLIFKRPAGHSQVFYGHHAYAVLDVTHRGDLVLYNPHGYNLQALDDTTWGNRKAPLPGAFVLEREYLDHVVANAYVGRFKPRSGNA